MKVLKKTLRNMRRSPYQVLAAVLVLSTSFFISLLVAIIALSLYQALEYFESTPQVLIFFKHDATETQIQSLKTQLENNPSVTYVEYVPQEKALDLYQEMTKDDPLLLELVTAEILPASLEVSTNEITALGGIAQVANGVEGVDEVVYRQDIVDELQRWMGGIQYSGTIFVIIMTVTSIMTVVTVVGMKIAGKNYEIRVLRLIGASGWYIQGPFLMEGFLYGILAAIIAFITIITILLYATPIILNFAGEVPLLPTSPLILVYLFGGVLVIGAFVGTLGSWISIKRYLKV